MELGWGLLTVILLAAAVVWFWQDSLAARESANAAAKEACNRLSLQFLDGTVAFARLALVRADGGRLKLRRTYVFDYTSNSIERRQGFVVVSERSVETVGYARDEERQPRPAVPAPKWSVEEPAERPREMGRVIQLDDRRRQSNSNSPHNTDPPEVNE